MSDKGEDRTLAGEVLTGHELLAAFVKQYRSGAQGAEMDCDTAQSLANAISSLLRENAALRAELTERHEDTERLRAMVEQWRSARRERDALRTEVLRLEADCEGMADTIGKLGEQLAEAKTAATKLADRGTLQALKDANDRAEAAEEKCAALRAALERLDGLLDFSDEALDTVWHFDSIESVQDAFKQARAALSPSTDDQPAGGER